MGDFVKPGTAPTPWSPSKATEAIRQYARGEFALSYKLHAKERMEERGLVQSDIVHVLKNGFVYADAIPATPIGYFRYAIEGSAPNSGGRSLRVVVIPSQCRAEIKVVTVMWADEN
jgi:hypothetical protein